MEPCEPSTSAAENESTNNSKPKGKCDSAKIKKLISIRQRIIKDINKIDTREIPMNDDCDEYDDEWMEMCAYKKKLVKSLKKIEIRLEELGQIDTSEAPEYSSFLHDQCQPIRVAEFSSDCLNVAFSDLLAEKCKKTSKYINVRPTDKEIWSTICAAYEQEMKEHGKSAIPNPKEGDREFFIFVRTKILTLCKSRAIDQLADLQDDHLRDAGLPLDPPIAIQRPVLHTHISLAEAKASMPRRDENDVEGREGESEDIDAEDPMMSASDDSDDDEYFSDDKGEADDTDVAKTDRKESPKTENVDMKVDNPNDVTPSASEERDVTQEVLSLTCVLEEINELHDASILRVQSKVPSKKEGDVKISAETQINSIYAPETLVPASSPENDECPAPSAAVIQSHGQQPENSDQSIVAGPRTNTCDASSESRKMGQGSKEQDVSQHGNVANNKRPAIVKLELLDGPAKKNPRIVEESVPSVKEINAWVHNENKAALTNCTPTAKTANEFCELRRQGLIRIGSAAEEDDDDIQIVFERVDEYEPIEQEINNEKFDDIWKWLEDVSPNVISTDLDSHKELEMPTSTGSLRNTCPPSGSDADPDIICID